MKSMVCKSVDYFLICQVKQFVHVEILKMSSCINIYNFCAQKICADLKYYRYVVLTEVLGDIYKRMNICTCYHFFFLTDFH